MDKDYSKGQTIIIRLEDEECYYEGKFHSMNQERTRISITNVIIHPGGQENAGLLSFYRTEIREIQAMDLHEGLEAMLDVKGRVLAHYKGPSHAHLSRMSGQTTKPALEPTDAGPVNWRSNAKYSSFVKKMDTYTIIDKIDAEFRNAVDILNSCKTVGIALEGVMLGRGGTLCWLNISTGSNTYMFDMLALGNVGFDEGLREVLQSEKVKKVMHDCRMAADYLLHKQNITLVSIMDTQVLDIMVKRVQQDKCPTFVSSLHHCIRDYLQVPRPILMFPLVREYCIKHDMDKWNQRPLAVSVQELAVINVVFLIELHHSLMNTLLQPALQGTQIFLNHVTSMDDKDAAMYYGCIHITPRQMSYIGKKRRDEERGMQRLNPHIRFSRDVMHYFEDESASDEEKSSIENSIQASESEVKIVDGLAAELTKINP